MITCKMSSSILSAIRRVQHSLPVSLRINYTKAQVRCRGYSANDAKEKATVRSLREAKKTDFDAKGYILLIVPIVTFGLGTWQVQRRKWKVRLIEELEKRTTAKPVPLPLDLSEMDDLEYCRVVVRGTFDHSKELHVMPRSLVPGTEPDRRTMSPSDKRVQHAAIKSGANVITAFNVDSHDHSHNLRILVNRGWVPQNRLKPEARPEGQIKEPVELVGLVRLTEVRGGFSPTNDPKTNQWYTRDIEHMAEELGTSTVFVDADIKSTVPGGPVGGQTIVTLRNEHLQYILTWYTLSAATLFMWFKYYWKR